MILPAASERPRHTNSFDLLRIVAAASVVMSHSWTLTGHSGVLLIRWNDRMLDLGGFAVVVFFVVSGYLVAGSWTAEPNISVFFAKRALRIFPGLAAVVILSTFILGPAVTSDSLGRYLTSGGTWNYLGTLTLTPIRVVLPGVFPKNPVPYVNGSLWTLPVEMICYCVLGVLGFLGVVRRRWPFLLAVVLLTAIREGLLYGTSVDLQLSGLMMFFFMASLLRTYCVRICLPGSLIALGLVVASLATGVFVVGVPGLVYLIVYLGSRPTPIAAMLARYGDPSYGIYIYAYPIEQTLILLGLRSPGWLLAVALPVSVAAGYASWRLIELPVMKAGRAALRRQGTSPAPIPTPSLRVAVDQ